jgi:arsenite methyltransferase
MNASDTAKACCANVYASDWARLLIGESLHPGGLALTERLAELAGISAGSRVLDLASGRGASALHVAREFGCLVTGIDYSSESVAAANDSAERSGLADHVRFHTGDAERLDAFQAESFDVVTCECALCTFVDKPAAMREIARVLRPGGRFGLSDLTRAGPLPPELDGLLAWIACIADALPLQRYVDYCRVAGMAIERFEDQSDALVELVDTIRGRLVTAELVLKLQQLQLSGADFQQARAVALSATRAVEAGTLGYMLLVAAKAA